MIKPIQTKKTNKPPKPRGRQEIMAAFLAAADRLFGQKGPDAVSVRDIAAAAGLMPTLIHRYFDSKDDLIRQVLRLHIATFREAAGSMTNPQTVVKSMFDVMAKNPAFLRVIAYIVLEGHEPEAYLTKSGMVASLADAVTSVYKKNAKLESAILVSQMAGWLLFEPFLLYSSDYEGDPATARAEVLSRLVNSLPRSRSSRPRSPASPKSP
jgi:AcrR family transcriptional regulator